MVSQKIRILISLAVVVAATSVATAAKPIDKAQGRPLKVFILAGQSNMQGKARVRTIERLNLTDDARQMYKDMQVKDGLPSPVKGVHCAYFTGGRQGPVAYKGPLRPGYEGEMTADSSFGPEYTFGIYMQKHLNEPFLIIKTAWGGKNLLQQFRPPSAGDYAMPESKIEKYKAEGKLDEALAEHKKKTGEYYRLMMKHVNEVLADPGKYHPAYDKKAGYEIAGFVWFQGFNDLVGPYPQGEAEDGKKAYKDYTEYGRLMAIFIRDVRKALKAPRMPFVIGVLGVGGVDKEHPFRIAQEAPAALPEFNGNVAAVRTGPYWDMELEKLIAKVNDASRKKAVADNPALAKKPRALSHAVHRMRKEMTAKVLTPEEAHFMKVAQSNAGYHYMGSAYTYGNIGKAFADAMARMGKKN